MKAGMLAAGHHALRGSFACGLALVALAMPNVARGESSLPAWYNYQTTGWVEQPSAPYDPWANHQPIQFSGTNSGAYFILGQPYWFYLGSFEVKRHDLGGSYTFNDMPFGIKLVLDDMNPNTQFDPVVLLTGVLNGTITGNAISTMTATVTSIVSDPWTVLPPFDLSKAVVDIISNPLNPPDVNAGRTYVYMTQPVPEPSSLLVMGSMTLAFGLWSHNRRARSAGA